MGGLVVEDALRLGGQRGSGCYLAREATFLLCLDTSEFRIDVMHLLCYSTRVLFWRGTRLKKTNALKRLATRLLATTCLTAAASVAALGSTITEPGGGFGHTFPGTELPAGTTQVDGTASLNHGSNEYYEFQGLPGGVSLSSLSFSFLNNGVRGIGVELLNDADAVVTAESVVGAGATFNPVGTVPMDGFLVVDIKAGNESGTPYVLTLNLPSGTPEPGTFGTLGAGLAGLGALVLRRRLRKS
ncbi:MAG: PEP-CTERM sorting domain-containing protein [Bryobacteraceae bacterium]|jgi:hypothetical protein